MYTQKQKLLLNRSHLKKNVFVLFKVSTQEYIPRAYKYYELEECQNVLFQYHEYYMTLNSCTSFVVDLIC